ncbi:basement membrane proteoglycan-like [Cheilinus undulatus]|uniref:basement membrane proteoglycan-like n=1 Tax=Cheilinus undulatus TaxID=241271 RepID=UPI001BD3A16D|nr:basement membrane proteoglycan-like [Cheilinus undulatus]
MFLCKGIFALAFFNFLNDIHVSGCDTNCSDKPKFTPSTLVVKYGDPASAICTVCERDCLNQVFDLERSVGSRTKNGTTITWTIDSLTEWDLSLQCYYNTESNDQCCSILPFTLYKPPDTVSFSFSDHTGPLLEYKLYTMECNVKNVAPIENVTAVFYRDDNPFVWVKVRDLNDIKPVDHIFTHEIFPMRYQEGAVYWCAAELNLGSEGPQPPPEVMSQKMPTTIYYKPELGTRGFPEMKDAVEGDKLELNCTCIGNPTPSYNWTHPSGRPFPFTGSILIIDSVTTEDSGRFTCRAINSVGSFKVEFDVNVRVNYIKYIIVGLLIGLVLLVVIAIIIYICYKNKRMGRNNLREVFGLRPQHAPVPNVE